MSTFTYGQTLPGTVAGGTRNDVHFVPVEVDLAGIVGSISVSSASLGETYVSGIYDDAGGFPGTLLGQTADAPFAQGVNANDPTVTLRIPKPGTYWIAVSYSGSPASRIVFFEDGPQNVRSLTRSSYSAVLPSPPGSGGAPLNPAIRQFTASILLLGYDAFAEGTGRAVAVGGGIIRSVAIASGFNASNAVPAATIARQASAAGQGTAAGVASGPGKASAGGLAIALGVRGDPKGAASGIGSALGVGAGPFTLRFAAAGASTGNAVSNALIEAFAYSAGQASTRIIGPPCPGPPLPALGFSDLLSAPSGDLLLPSIISQTPRGAAWRTDEQSDSTHLSFQHRFWRAVADPVADLYFKAWKLALNSTALTIQDDLGNDALGDWEHDHGLPSSCLAGEDLTRDRRKLLLRQHISSEQIVVHGGQSIQFFICIALELGYEITITEYIPLRCGQGRCGLTQIGGQVNEVFWRVFVKTPVIFWFRCGTGMCGRDPLGSFGRRKDLECLLNLWKPAHTQIRFHYLYTGGVAWGSAGGASTAAAVSVMLGVAVSAGLAGATGWGGVNQIEAGEAHSAGQAVAPGIGRGTTGAG